MKRCLIAFACLFAVSTAQAETALTNRATDVLAQPQSDAAKVATLPESTKVELTRRQGAWAEVKTSTKQAGWVRLLHLQLEPGKAGAGLGNLLSSGRTSNSGTVTTGVRGLTAEELRQARPNADEFKKMQQYAVGKDIAQDFAAKSRLAPQAVDYLRETSAPPAPEPAGHNPLGG